MSFVSLKIIVGPTFERDPDGWDHYAYVVELHNEGRTLTTPWKQGMALSDDPTAAQVLENLLSDAVSIFNLEDGDSFEEWAYEYGLDADSRKAEAMYTLMRALAYNLLDFLDVDRVAFMRLADSFEDNEEMAESLTR